MFTTVFLLCSFNLIPWFWDLWSLYYLTELGFFIFNGKFWVFPLSMRRTLGHCWTEQRIYFTNLNDFGLIGFASFLVSSRHVDIVWWSTCPCIFWKLRVEQQEFCFLILFHPLFWRSLFKRNPLIFFGFLQLSGTCLFSTVSQKQWLTILRPFQTILWIFRSEFIRWLQQSHFYKNYKRDSLQTKSYLSSFFSYHCCDDWVNQLHATNDWCRGFKLLFLTFLFLLHSSSTMGLMHSFHLLYSNTIFAIISY